MSEKLKEYQVKIERTYTTYVILKFPDNGKDHKEIINDKLTNAFASDELEGLDIWDLIAEKELEQMEVNNEHWEISEINNNTIAGALSPDTGPRN